MRIEAYEEVFLWISGVVLLVFLAALVYAAVGMHIHVMGRAGEIDPGTISQTPPFDHPGVREIAPGKYEAVIIGKAWSFIPKTIEVPAGAEVTFRATSADVDHGFYIDGTRVNLMLIPGQVSVMTYRFREPGTHLLICHEYCGLGHQFMYGRVIVK